MFSKNRLHSIMFSIREFYTVANYATLCGYMIISLVPGMPAVITAGSPPAIVCDYLDSQLFPQFKEVNLLDDK